MNEEYVGLARVLLAGDEYTTLHEFNPFNAGKIIGTEVVIEPRKWLPTTGTVVEYKIVKFNIYHLINECECIKGTIVGTVNKF